MINVKNIEIARNFAIYKRVRARVEDVCLDVNYVEAVHVRVNTTDHTVDVYAHLSGYCPEQEEDATRKDLHKCIRRVVLRPSWGVRIALVREDWP